MMTYEEPGLYVVYDEDTEKQLKLIDDAEVAFYKKSKIIHGGEIPPDYIRLSQSMKEFDKLRKLVKGNASGIVSIVVDTEKITL